MHISRAFLLVIFALNLSRAFGQTASTNPSCSQCARWQALSSLDIVFPTQDSDYWQNSDVDTYPKPLRWLFDGPLKWYPEQTGAMKTSCPLALRELRQTSIQKLSDEDLNLYFADCAKADSWSSYLGFIKMLGIDFQHEKNPFFHSVVLNMPEGQKIRGILGLHSFDQSRPLVVLRLGVFGNALEFLGEKYLPLQLFEQGPFNILIIESTSGSDYLAMNKQRAGLAGTDEGLQNYFVAQRLSDKNEPLSQLVSSIHFVGVSLGGQGIFVMSELMKKHPISKVKNFVAMCPVVDLHASLRGLVQAPFKGFLADLWVQRRLGKFVQNKYGEQFKGRSFWGEISLKPEFTLNLIDLLDQTAQVPDFKSWGASEKDVSAKVSLEIQPQKFHLSSAPFTVISAKDDNIVLFDKNTKRLRPLESQMPNFKIFALPKGHHCAYPVVYDWPLVAEFMKKTVAANMTFDLKFHEAVIPIGAEGANTSLDISQISYDDETNQWKADLLNGRTGEKIAFQFSRDDLDFTFPNQYLSDQEKVVGIRWLWQNLEVQRDDVRGIWKLRWPTFHFTR